jgi:peroxiredoxin Q/BCP
VEATEFRDRIPDFEQLDVAVFGLSPDDLASHRAFAAKHQLNFPLLAAPRGGRPQDAGRGVIEQWGLCGEIERDGKKINTVFRTTVLVGPDGRVERLWERVQFQGHAGEVLAAVREIVSRVTG